MLDPSDDFAAVTDGVETVTLLRYGATPGTTGETVIHALRRAMTTGEATIVNRGDVHKRVASRGQQTAADIVWHLPVAELVVAPRLGDVIIDGRRQRWPVLEVKRATLGTRWRCAARNVAIAFGLDDTISVLKATYIKGDCGAAEPQWRTWRTGVCARIQPQDIKVAASADSHTTLTRYRIFVEETLALDHTCRILGADGKLYTITSAAGAERIGELQVIDAEVMR